MSHNIWRFTNNSTSLGNSALGDLAANQAIDVPASDVAVGWNVANGPWSTAERFYVKNQITRLQGVPDAGADALIVGVGSGGTQVARAELITNNGLGTILFTQEA